MSLLWVNGTLTDKADARVSPFDHGFLYGDGVWEHLRVFGGKLFRPQEHLALLLAAAETLGIDIPLSRDELLAAIETTVAANNRTEGYVRLIVTRGPGTIGPDPRKLDPQVYITAEEYQPFPPELYGHGLHAVLAPVPVDVANPAFAVRSLGRPHVVLAKQHALRNGCLEAILVNNAGQVMDTTEGILLIVKDGVVVVPGGQPPDAAGLAVSTLAGEAGLVVVEYAVKPVELTSADEVLVAGTSCGVIGLVRLDGRTIGTGTEGPVTRRLRDAYHTLTRGG
jgi:branched-chain amino acid aminotransferase